MSIEIRIPKEIKDYKSKSYFGFSLRQFIAIALAVVINVPLYIFSNKYIGTDAASWLVIIVAIPIALMGFFQFAGLNFEKFMMAFINTVLINPQKRIYKTENKYQYFLDEIGRKDANLHNEAKKKRK